MGDEFAHIQWGEDFGSPTEGIVDYDDYAEWAAKVKSSVPGDLNEIALWVLFDSVEPSDFFWKEANAGGFEQIEKADPSLLDEIAEYFNYESRAELIYELADSSELCAWFSGSIEDEGEEERGEELLERLENILD